MDVMHFKQVELKNISKLNNMEIDIDEDQLKPEAILGRKIILKS